MTLQQWSIFVVLQTGYIAQNSMWRGFRTNPNFPSCRVLEVGWGKERGDGCPKTKVRGSPPQCGGRQTSPTRGRKMPEVLQEQALSPPGGTDGPPARMNNRIAPRPGHLWGTLRKGKGSEVTVSSCVWPYIGAKKRMWGSQKKWEYLARCVRMTNGSEPERDRNRRPRWLGLEESCLRRRC
jgi:hypothetical protein